MKMELIIRLTDDGQVTVDGPVQDKIFCFGLLEVAKIAINNFKPGAIAVPKGSMLKVVEEKLKQ